MDKIVVLTGSTGYLGKQIIKSFEKKNDIRLIKVTSSKIAKSDYFRINFEDQVQIKKFFEKIRKRIGEPDVLINNAAINTKKIQDFVKNSSDLHIYKTYKINSYSTLIFTKYFLKKSNKIKNSKTVINLLTRSSIWGNKRHIDYYSSKAAVYNASRSLANDYKNVNFYNFLPGPIGHKKFQTDPTVIINEIYKCCFIEHKNNYHDIYFESYFDFTQRIIKSIYNYLSKIIVVRTS